MFRNITLGRYYPIDSPVHRMDPRGKIILTGLYMGLVFTAKTFWGYGIVALLVCFITLCSHIPIMTVIRGLRPILFIVLFTFVVNLFFAGSGAVLWQWGILRITEGGLRMAVTMLLRLSLLVMGTSILTLTTSPVELTDGLERVLLPLSWLRFPVHELSMMMTIALRMIPTLAEEADRIMKAQAARGADFETGGLFARARAMVPLLVPLFVGAFRRADDLGIAMEARCYSGKEGRTRMKILHMGLVDILAMGAFVLAIVVFRVGGL
ncbi:energy-coupling factor transporter transmembrane protein EcfT [Eubacteriales bacterium OttesenSCG-928-M02]|nr:energy-coupling factor transporter transmembrane protein EcfT [Eubacteriales bacterium OttesenSCG-928-M02]